MSTRINFPLSGNIEQALLKLQIRLDQSFGSKALDLEYVRDAAGAVTAVQVIIPDGTPQEEVVAFMRAMRNLDGRVGETVQVPRGAGGAVSVNVGGDFETGFPGDPPAGFAVEGEVVVAAAGTPTTAALTTILVPEPYDLSDSVLEAGLAFGIVPTTVVVSVTIDGVVETITDDVGGVLTGTNGSLPGDGTIDHSTGEVTGLTVDLDPGSTVDVSYRRLVDIPPTVLATIPAPATHDLSTTPLPQVGDGISPGSVTINTDMEGVGGSQISDDGAGNLTGANGVLPGGGTINYLTGAMTGVTATLNGGGSEVNANYSVEEIVQDVLQTIGDPAEVDLSTVPIPVGTSSIIPGSVSITVTIEEEEEIITDDENGVLTNLAALPAGGTVNYQTGEMTGLTEFVDGLSTVSATYTLAKGAHTTLSSGGVAGEAKLATAAASAVGAEIDGLSWAFSLRFPEDFGLNNNGVTGAQPLSLTSRLLGVLRGGGDVELRWAVNTDNAVAPTAWGTPVFTRSGITTSPTADLALPINGGWGVVRFDRVRARVMRVTVGSNSQEFAFPQDIVSPRSVELVMSWGAALDRSFGVDDWSFVYTLPVPPSIAVD